MSSGVAVHHSALNSFIDFTKSSVQAGCQRGFSLFTWGLAVGTACSETALHEGTQR